MRKPEKPFTQTSFTFVLRRGRVFDAEAPEQKDFTKPRISVKVKGEEKVAGQ